MQSNLLQKAARATLFVALFATGVGTALAWTGPSTAPPNGNTSSPVNISATAQTKTGNLSVGSAIFMPGLGSNGGYGQGVSSGFYFDASNLALRAPNAGAGGTYFQDQGGGRTWAEIGAAWNGIRSEANIIAAGSITAVGNLYSGNGGSFFASNGDSFMGYSGQYLSSVLGWNGSSYNVSNEGADWGHKSGGGYGTGPGGCIVGNAFTGGCSCPSWAPISAEAEFVVSNGEGWYTFMCVGN